MIPLQVARYRLNCIAETTLRLPEYAGSALRGALGHALKRSVCVTRERDCKACALYRTCVYPAIFEPPPPEEHAIQRFSQIPAPYVVEPPEWGEKVYAKGQPFHFHMVLMGRALKHIPLIIHAWQRALALGVGTGDGRSNLLTVDYCGDERASRIYDAQVGECLPHEIDSLHVPDAQSSVELEIQTPLRLQHEGRPLRPQEINAERLLISLIKRVSLVSEFHGSGPLSLDFSAIKVAARDLTSDQQLTWRDWGRYSSRQQQDMKLGGVVGRWKLAGDLRPFWPHVHAGQWLHVGKNASFGLGKYAILDASSPHSLTGGA